MHQNHKDVYTCTPTHTSFIHRYSNLAMQTECNSVSRLTVNVKMSYVHWFQMLFIIRWKSQFSVQNFFMLSQWQGHTKCSMFCYICMHILLSLFSILMVCFLSLSLSLSIFVSLLCFLFPLLLSVCLCAVCFSVSQADDDSSQTSPDYTVRPNIKIHNIGEWLWKWTAANCQMLVNIWLWLQCLICVPIIVERKQPFVSVLFHGWQKKIHSWLVTKTFIFLSWALHNMGKTMDIAKWFSSSEKKS